MRLALLALAPLCLLTTASYAGEGVSDFARAELERRASAAAEAHELLKKGDVAYEAGRYEEAMTDYRSAVDLLPQGSPAVEATRSAAIQRYAQASVEVSRKQRRLGDLEGAEATVNAVLAEEIAPDNFQALAMLDQIQDPIRTNPASSKEHTADIEEVRLLLYKAQGAYDLGKYEEAGMVFEAVLNIDPSNRAARRGMEKTAAAKSDYYRAAYDQTRAEMLSDVAGAWELDVPAPDDLIAPISYTEAATIDYINKLTDIVIPVVSLEDVDILEAVDFLRLQSAALDTSELDPAQRGVNFVLDLGSEDSEIGNRVRNERISLNLRNVPLRTVLDYICEKTRTTALEQPFAVVIRPAGADTTDLLVKTYRVPPDFLTVGSAEASGVGEVADNDPFSNAPEAGMLAKKLSAKEVLLNRGVSFPEGATANFNAGNSTLRVMNTAGNHSLVGQIVDALANEEPTSVIVEVKVIKTQQKRLEELSFDWLMGSQSLGGTGGVPGRGAGYLTGGTVGNGNPFLDTQVPIGSTERNPITSGNRSGDQAIGGNSLDELILDSSRGFGEVDKRAPGILQVTGLFNNSYVSMVMRGLDQKTGVDLAAVPSVVTRSGQAATVKIVQEFIYPTEYEPPELPNSVGVTDGFIDNGGGGLPVLGGGGGGGTFPVTPATPTSFETRDLGITLEVLPTVSKDKRYVDITLKPSISDFDGFVNFGSPIRSGDTAGGGFFSTLGLIDQPGVIITPNRILMPVISDMSTETALTVADGQTVVMSGLMQDRVQTVEDKTPILGDIPLVGRLFQSRASSPVQTAIVFMVTVRVVDGAGRSFNR